MKKIFSFFKNTTTGMNPFFTCKILYETCMEGGLGEEDMIRHLEGCVFYAILGMVVMAISSLFPAAIGEYIFYWGVSVSGYGFVAFTYFPLLGVAIPIVYLLNIFKKVIR